MDDKSASDTIPFNEILNGNVSMEHEAKVSKISEEQLYYLMSRGISEEKATEMIIMGFVEPFTKELPMEYAVELNRLIEYQMEDSVELEENTSWHLAGMCFLYGMINYNCAMV